MNIYIKCRRYRVLGNNRDIEVDIGIPIIGREEVFKSKFTIPKIEAITLKDGCLAVPVFSGANEVEYVPSDIHGIVTFYDPVNYSYPRRLINLKDVVIIREPERREDIPKK
jgi:hypothetical protein